MNWKIFALGIAVGMVLEALTPIYAKHRARRFTARREAHQLIQSARRGTDLDDLRDASTRVPTPNPNEIPTPHWSDVCRTCHHERTLHDQTGCWQGRLGRFCPCTHFETNP